MLLVVLALASLLNISLAEAAIQSRTAELSFVPYTSSYLPLAHGMIVKPFERGRAHTLPIGQLGAEYLEDLQSNRSVLSRFDAARERVLGVRESLDTIYRTHFFREQRDIAEGYCHQWSLASLHPKINAFLAGTGGLACNGIFLTKGELKELFTAFYEMDESNLSGVGGRSREDHSDSWLAVRDQLGVDDLPAHRFHEFLFEQLERDEGLVIDVDPQANIWNQPIYRATTEVAVLKSSIAFYYETHLVPSSLLVSQDLEYERLLRQVDALEQVLKKAALGKLDREEYRAAIKPFETFSERWFGESATFVELTNRRTKLMLDTIAPAIEKGIIQLRPGIRVKNVRTRVVFAQEDLFTGLNTVSPGNGEFTYFVFEKDGVAIDSSWRTEAKNRPDFLWISPRIDLENPATREMPGRFRAALYDLYRLTQVCTDLSTLRGAVSGR